MGASSVLVVGLDGLGVEIAKNVILAGVKEVVLCDEAVVSMPDLSSQFYLRESDVGKVSRAQASQSKLAELNPYVSVRRHEGPLSDEFVGGFTVVVCCNRRLQESLQLNEVVRSAGGGFIWTNSRGLFSNVFVDFGDSFHVSDTDGEPPFAGMVSTISQEEKGCVTVIDEKRHGLETGDTVVFSDLNGMEELNGTEPIAVTATGPYTFLIGDTRGLSQHINGGYYTQVKQPATVSFKPFKESLAHPEILVTDFAKIDHGPVMHLGFQALEAFQDRHQALPLPGNVAHAAEVVAIAREINESKDNQKVSNLEDFSDLLGKFARGASGILNPMCAFLGGVVGQEVLKGCSSKFMPIRQWLYFDGVECLPAEPIPESEVQPLGCRYDGQIAVFGKTFQDKLAEMQFFLVGAGAIGCEMMKNWAMMGVATSSGGGKVHVTDMDCIEKSNLSRQFLFRNSDISKAKSITACNACKAMNPDFDTQAYENRVGKETEDLFNDEFWESLSGVCTALDNVEARLYVDQRCVYYQKPMLESGTLGTKGNTQVVVPFLTESYGASRDPPEKSVPICTLKNFPNQIEHTLQWARDWFEGEFFQGPSDVNSYLGNPKFMEELDSQPQNKLTKLEGIRMRLVTERPLKFEECVVWARNLFEEQFSNVIKQLLHNFPKDSLTSSGHLFWSGPKKAPDPLVFDMNDPMHQQFIIAAANMKAMTYGLAGSTDFQSFVGILESAKVTVFKPKDGVTIAANDEEAKKIEEERRNQDLVDVDEQCASILNELPSTSQLAGYRMDPVEFEKDDDSHMMLIVATSNLRARSYRIPEADLHKSRQIAGKIIPAIATTTALVTGWVCLELYKFAQKKPLEAYKNGFVNLAVPIFNCSEPIAPKGTKCTIKGEEWTWSQWDRIEIDKGDLTLREFIDHVEQEYEVEVSMLSYGVSILFSFFGNKKKMKERMDQPMSKVIEMVTKQAVDTSKKYLSFDVCATDAEGEDLEIPSVRLRL